MGKMISVPDMHCEKCVSRISEALNKVQIEAMVDLQTKSVEVRNETDYKTAFDEIYDLGFSPEEV